MKMILENDFVQIGENVCFADYLLDGEYMEIALDLRDYEGALNKSVTGTQVVICDLSEIPEVFNPKSEANVGRRYTYADYCSYVNRNLAVS